MMKTFKAHEVIKQPPSRAGRTFYYFVVTATMRRGALSFTLAQSTGWLLILLDI